MESGTWDKNTFCVWRYSKYHTYLQYCFLSCFPVVLRHLWNILLTLSVTEVKKTSIWSAPMSFNGEVSFLHHLFFYRLLRMNKVLYISCLVYKATKLGSHRCDEIAKKILVSKKVWDIMDSSQQTLGINQRSTIWRSSLVIVAI